MDKRYDWMPGCGPRPPLSPDEIRPSYQIWCRYDGNACDTVYTLFSADDPALAFASSNQLRFVQSFAAKNDREAFEKFKAWGGQVGSNP